MICKNMNKKKKKTQFRGVGLKGTAVEDTKFQKVSSNLKKLSSQSFEVAFESYRDYILSHYESGTVLLAKDKICPSQWGQNNPLTTVIGGRYF